MACGPRGLIRSEGDEYTMVTNYAGSGEPAQRTQVDPAAAVSAPTSRWVEWGPVWAGVLVALPTFVVLQLLFVAFGWLDLGINGAGQNAATGLVSAVLALVAFVVGGLLAGRSLSRSDPRTGLRHGVLVWALGVSGILVAGLLGGGALLGSFGASASQLANLQQQISQPAVAAGLEAAQQGAGWAALWLGLAIIAAAVGGVVGSLSHQHDQHAGTR